MDPEADIDYTLDSPTIAANKNVTVSKEARAAIADGLLKFFEQQYKMPPEWIEFHFSNSIAEDTAEECSLRSIGVAVGTSDAFALHKDALKAIAAHVMDFGNDVCVEGHRTFQADNNKFSANTWEDVVTGLNKSFEKAGSDVRIDPTIVKSRC